MMAKSKSHKNRGLKFEALIQEKCDELKEQGIALISKVPTEWKVIRNGFKIISAFPVAESKFVDFVGIHNGLAVAIEAKETKEENRFPFSNIKDSQIEFLKRWGELGGKGYYLIRFSTHNKVFLVDSTTMHDCIENVGRKSAPYGWFEETDSVVEIDANTLNFIEFIN